MPKVLVRAELLRPTADGDVPANGYIEAKPSLRRDLDDPDAVVLPSRFTARLGAALDYVDNDDVEQTAAAEDGVAWFWIDPNDAGDYADQWFWTFTERTSGGTRRYVIVPTSIGIVDYSDDLTDIDPDTYDPAVDATAAWYIALANAETAIADEATVRAADDLELQVDIAAEEVARAAAVTDLAAIARLDRQSIEAARVGGGKAIAEYGDSIEVTETWADQAGVLAATNGQVVGNRWYADNSAAPGGFTKAISVPATGRWRLQTLMYHKAGGAASFYFGVDCGTSGHALAANDPDTIVIGISNANARNKVMGANLTAGGVTNEAATTLGSNPTVDRTYLVTIDADDIWLTLTMKAVGVIGDLHSWRVRRAQLASAGKTVNNIYCYLTDARGSAGSGLGPFILSTGTLQPTRTKTLASQTIEGAEFRIRNTSKDATSAQWLYALPKSYEPRKPSPVVLWAHQSLTGAAVDPWEETRVQPVTQALLDAGFIVAAVSTTDNYGNDTETDLYHELYKHLRTNFNTGPLFWYGASMGALTMFNAISHREWPTPAAAAAVGGAYSLRGVYDLPAYTALVQAAYGIAGNGSDYDAKTAGYDPILRDGADFRGVPIRLYTSAGDTVQPPAGSEAFADLLTPYAPEADVVYGTGAHLDPSQYQAADVVAFFTRYL